MEKRKIVKSGNTSFTLALPIDWIRKNKLEKGSEVDLTQNETGEIVISFEGNKNKFFNPVKTIKVDGKKIEEISLELLTTYLKDYTSISLEGKEINAKKKEILNEMKNFIGLDIIEQTSNSLTIKNFSSLDKEMSPKNLIRKMELSIKTMLDMLSSFFKEGLSKEEFYELQKIREQNERIFLLTRKIILKIMENPYLMRDFQTTFHQLTKDKVMSVNFRQLSFALELLGKSLFYLEHTRKDIEVLKNILTAISQEYALIMNAMRYKKYEDTFGFFNRHDINYRNWESNLKEAKDPLIIEAINYAIFINDILYQLAFEVIE